MNLRSFLEVFVIGTCLFGCAVTQRKTAWWMEDPSPIVSILDEMEREGKQVRLAFVATVETAYSPEQYRERGLNIEQWERTIQQDLVARGEQALLSRFGDRPGFTIVDCAASNNLLHEIHFESSGTVPGSVPVKLGRMFRATYILFLHSSRNPKASDPSKHIDTVTTRLIDVETGAVLASQSTTR